MHKLAQFDGSTEEKWIMLNELFEKIMQFEYCMIS